MVRSFWKKTLVLALSCGGAGWSLAVEPPPALLPAPVGNATPIPQPVPADNIAVTPTPPVAVVNAAAPAEPIPAPKTQVPAGNIITIQEPGGAKQECIVLREWPMPDGNTGRILLNTATGEEMTVVDSGPLSQGAVQPHRLAARIFHWGENHTPPEGTPMPPLVGGMPSGPIVVSPQPAPTPYVVAEGVPPGFTPAPEAPHRGPFGSSWAFSWRKDPAQQMQPGVVVGAPPSAVAVGSPQSVAVSTVVVNGAPQPVDPVVQTPPRGPFGSSWAFWSHKDPAPQVQPTTTTPGETVVVVGDGASGSVPAHHTYLPIAGLFGKKTDTETAPTPVVTTPVVAIPVVTTPVATKPVVGTPVATTPVLPTPVAITPQPPAPHTTGPGSMAIVIHDSPTPKNLTPAPTAAKPLSPEKKPSEAVADAAPPKHHFWPFNLMQGPATSAKTSTSEVASVKTDATVKATPAVDSNPWSRYRAPYQTASSAPATATPSTTTPTKGPYASMVAASTGTVTTEPAQPSDWRRSWGKSVVAEGQGSLAVKPADATAKPVVETAKKDPKADAAKKDAVAKKDDTAKVTVQATVKVAPPPVQPPTPRVEVAVDLPRAEPKQADPLSNPDQFSRRPLDGGWGTAPIGQPVAALPSDAPPRGVAKPASSTVTAALDKPLPRQASKLMAGNKPPPELLSVAVAGSATTGATTTGKKVAVVVTPPAKVIPVALQTAGKAEMVSEEPGVANMGRAPLGSGSVMAAYDGGRGVVYLPAPPSGHIPDSAPDAKSGAAAAPSVKAAATADEQANAFGSGVPYQPQPQVQEEGAFNAFSPMRSGNNPMAGGYPQGMMPPQGMMMPPQGMMMPPQMAMAQPVYQAGYGYPGGMAAPAPGYPGMAMPYAPVMAAYGPAMPGQGQPAAIPAAYYAPYGPAAVPTAPAPPTVPQLLYNLREAMYPSSRQRAAETLASYDARTNPEVVEALLLGAREDPAPTVRAGCVRGLSHMNPGSTTVKTAIEALRTDPDPRVRQEAEEALVKIGGAPVSPVLPAAAVEPARPQ